MFELPGYNIQKIIYESMETRVFRAFRNDNIPVIIKQYYNNNHYAYNNEEVSGIYHEYQVNRKLLNQQGVIHVYEFSSAHDFPVIVMEDIEGESLADILKSGKLQLPDFLNLSIQLADAIGTIHKNNIIHKDINPSNIIWNRKKDIVRIIDFGIATELPREITSVKNPSTLEGTIEYISPEQTGRMNRNMDYRTDFYSLGITLYQMITGLLPFMSKDLLQIVHSHIAVQPVPPHEIDASLPEAISAIIMKLVAKNVEDRYQSAHGLKADLERCEKELENRGVIGDFSLGSKDVSGRFQIPQKLYGREKEIETLLSTFERTSESKTELLLVSGFPGIGKSVLVQEIQKPIVKHRGNFISGKFEKLKKGIPYSAFIHAFSDFARQILAEKDSEVRIWKEKILSALGPNGKIITDMIPLFKFIIGEQADVPELGLMESQNRFNLVFQKFTGVLSSKEHPLVIFLDDLQWIDSASLQLLKLIAINSEIRYLLIIGTYRHNETPESHPLMLTLDEIAKSNVRINSIFLYPITGGNVSQLLRDTLNCTIEDTEFLAELVVQKTGGNPFFVHEFLKSLYKKQLIEFSFENGWSWDMDRVKKAQATDNVMELMTGNINELSPDSREIVKLGACTGTYFDLTTLITISGKKEEVILSALGEAIQEGIVNKIDDIYKFNHECVLEAAYSLVSDEEKIKQHYRIGNLELKNIDKEKLREKVFYIVNHLNAGVALVTDKSEKQNLAELNFMAGKKALSSSAYESAFNYLQFSTELLEPDCWQENYDFTLELFQETARAAHLCAEYEIMDKTIQLVFQNARSILDAIKTYETRIMSFIAQDQPLEGIKTGINVLKMFGLKLPQKPGKLRFMYEFFLLKLSLRGKSIDNLENLPEIKDMNMLAIMRIISLINPSVYALIPELISLLTFNAVRLSIKYGNSAYSPYFYSTVGMIYCAALGDIDSGYKWGRQAMVIVEKLGIRKTRSKVWCVFWNFINHWKMPLRDSLKPLFNAYLISLETGDLEFAAVNLLFHSAFMFFSGWKLESLEKELEQNRKIINELNQNIYFSILTQFHQATLNLLGKSQNPCKLVGSSYNENKVSKSQSQVYLFAYYYLLTHLNYLFEDYKNALKNMELLEPYMVTQISHPSIPVITFYDSLVHLALYLGEKKSVRRKYLKKIRKNQNKTRMWALHCPYNYNHKYHLVEAETARVQGQIKKAIDHYKIAAEQAHENKFIHEEALSLELYAKFWLGQNESKRAAFYFKEARDKYFKWGAGAKVKYLENKYNYLLDINSAINSESTSKP